MWMMLKSYSLNSQRLPYRLPRRARRFARLPVAAFCLCLLAECGAAQQSAPVPQPEEKPSLGADMTVMHRFLAVPGQRAVIQGFASEGLEVWAYPFQVLSNYRVAFRPTGTATPIDGSAILARVLYRPDAVTRVYLGPGFVVREKLFVPLDRPAAIVTYSVQAERPIEIQVQATPVMNLMWPAGVGGQSLEWNPSLAAFVLTEPENGFTAAVGSPQIAAHDNPGNRIPHGTADADFGFTLRPGPDGVAQVIVALNPPHAEKPGLLLDQLIHDSQALQAEAAIFSSSILQTIKSIGPSPGLKLRCIRHGSATPLLVAATLPATGPPVTPGVRSTSGSSPATAWSLPMQPSARETADTPAMNSNSSSVTRTRRRG
jgi:hypothetical protein